MTHPPSPNRLYARHIQHGLQKEMGHEIQIDYSWCLYFVQNHILWATDEARRMAKGPTSSNVRKVLLEAGRMKWRKDHHL